MSTTSEKERQKFYAKIVALPQMMMAEVNRDEVVSWYKRARKKYRVPDDDDDDNNGGVHRYNFDDPNNSSDNDSRRHLDAHAAILVLSQQQHQPPVPCDYDPLSRQALAAADDFNLSQLHLIPRAPVPDAPPLHEQRPRSDTYDQLHSSLPEVVDDELHSDSVLSLAHIGSALDPCHASSEAMEMAPPPFEGGLGIAPPISGAQAVIGL